MTTSMSGGITAVVKPVASNSSQRIRAVEAAASPSVVASVAAATHAVSDPALAMTQGQSAASELEEVQRALDRLKQSIKPALANSLEFQIDQSTGKTIVKILDAETSAVVRQIPSEELLTIARALDRMQGKGGLVRQQA